MEILKNHTVERAVETWNNQQEKTVSQVSCCCYCGD